MITTTHTTTQDQRRVLRQLADAVDQAIANPDQINPWAAAAELAEMVRAHLDATEPPSADDEAPDDETTPRCDLPGCGSAAEHFLAFGPRWGQIYWRCHVHVGELATPGSNLYMEASERHGVMRDADRREALAVVGGSTQPAQPDPSAYSKVLLALEGLSDAEISDLRRRLCADAPAVVEWTGEPVGAYGAKIAPIPPPSAPPADDANVRRLELAMSRAQGAIAAHLRGGAIDADINENLLLYVQQTLSGALEGGR